MVEKDETISMLETKVRVLQVQYETDLIELRNRARGGAAVFHNPPRPPGDTT